MRCSSILAAATLALGTSAMTQAHAQNTRSFVSSTGSDSNPCTLAAPCRSFQRAHNVTNAGGEVDALDSAGYGTLNITKAISIIGNGQAGILATCNFCVGVFLNAGGTDAVNLSGLVIEGAGTGNTGIQYGIGASLSIENCVIRGFTFAGIYQITDANNALLVSDTLISDSSGATGIFIAPSGGTPTALINRVTVTNHKDGLVSVAVGTSKLTVRDSLFSYNSNNGINLSPTGFNSALATFNHVEVDGNGNDGILVSGGSSTGTVNATVSESVASGNANFDYLAASSAGQAPTTLMVLHSVASGTRFAAGVAAQGSGAALNMANSMVTENAIGWSAANGGVLQSYGDNYIDGNAIGNTSPPSITQK
jgi:hypothetical protein